MGRPPALPGAGLLVAAAIALGACHQARAQPLRFDPAAPVAGSTPAAASSATDPVAAVRRDIDALLASPVLERGYWGVLINSLRTGETLYSLNARKLLMPASNMKIVTLAAAAQALGWDYRYETQVFTAGDIAAGRLAGDLIVAGSGDPSLTADTAPPLFDAWCERLKSLGISGIDGRIIGDDNAFDDEALGMGWSWDDLSEGYAAGVGALQFNENAAAVTVGPGAVLGDPASISIVPEGTGLIVRNHVITAAAASIEAVRAQRLAGSAALELRGSMPMGTAPRTRLVSVDNPTLFFVTTFRNALIAHGIDVRGAAVDIDDVTDAPPRGAAVISYLSPPLSSLADRMMKFSQNLYAETLLRTLGAAAGTPTPEGGVAAIESALSGWGLSDGSVIQRDGSGLSRYDYTTPESLVAILTHVDRDDALRAAFRASLPVAGRDGTLAHRMNGTRAEGNALAKSGSMSNVRALSGYVTTADGEPLVFSILVNNFETAGRVVAGTTDAIVVRLAQFSR